MLQLPKSVTVVEVGPRDGLQSFPRWVETDIKVKVIDRLSATGFPVIEVANFAHPHVIPNLRDAEQVLKRIARRPGAVYRALVPNARGAQRATAAKGVDEMLGLITVSATYLRKNQNMTADEAVAQAIEAFRIADRAGARFVMALGMAFWCPYEGRIPEDDVLALVARFRDAGMRRFYLAGSVGMEDPAHVNRLFRKLCDRWADTSFGFHVHNLAGMGTANILAALDGGASSIEGSICGIGGGITLPSALGLVGNIATEDAVHMLNEMGIETGLDTAAVIAAARDVAGWLGIRPQSHAAHCGTRADILRSETLAAGDRQ